MPGWVGAVEYARPREDGSGRGEPAVGFGPSATAGRVAPADAAVAAEVEEGRSPEKVATPTPEEPQREEHAEDAEPSHEEGSARPGPGGASPAGWRVKANADSMLFHTADAPRFGRAAADVWFVSEQAAAGAGFTRWDAHHR